jgi:hypothetical protein
MSDHPSNSDKQTPVVAYLGFDPTPSQRAVGGHGAARWAMIFALAGAFITLARATCAIVFPWQALVLQTVVAVLAVLFGSVAIALGHRDRLVSGIVAIALGIAEIAICLYLPRVIP